MPKTSLCLLLQTHLLEALWAYSDCQGESQQGTLSMRQEKGGQKQHVWVIRSRVPTVSCKPLGLSLAF